jgi:hypothetical protein
MLMRQHPAARLISSANAMARSFVPPQASRMSLRSGRTP